MLLPAMMREHYIDDVNTMTLGIQDFNLGD